MKSEVISIRLKKGTIDKLKELGINPPEEVRAHLENIAWEKDVERTLVRLAAIIRIHSKPSKFGFAVRSLREDRDEHH